MKSAPLTFLPIGCGDLKKKTLHCATNEMKIEYYVPSTAPNEFDSI